MAIDWLRYANQGATRNQPLSPQLVNALSFLPDMGVSMQVFSGGQDATGPHRTGSHRHDSGNAADVFFYKDGHQLDWANPQDRPLFEQIVSEGRGRGITGFGAGEGYMRPGSMHIGFGSPAVWGAGGSGANAPDWLRAAFNGSTAPAPQMAELPGKAGGSYTGPDGPKGQESYPPQGILATATDTAPQGILAKIFGGTTPEQGNAAAGLLGADENEKSPAQKFFEALSKTDNAELPRVGAIGDARPSGDALLKALSGPSIADFILKMRTQRG